MKYRKNSFITIPNKEVIKGKSALLQAVYLWICEHANSEGVCFPSRSTIAKEAGVNIKSVDRVIPELENIGILVKTSRKIGEKNMSNEYQIMIVDVKRGSVLQSLGGGDCESLGGDCESLGVAPKTVHELNPVLTQPTEHIPKPSVSPSLEEDLEIIPTDEDGNPIRTKKKKNPPKSSLTPLEYSKRATEIREKKLSPYSFDEELKKLWQSNWKPHKIVALFWEHKGYRFENAEQFKANLARDIKLSEPLKGYDSNQLEAAIRICKRESSKLNFDWKLTTVFKKINEINT